MRRRKTKSRHQSAKKRLDQVFSKWVRLSNADKNGYCTCVTCGNKFHWKDIQCGHWISRNHSATRWLSSNTGPQCRGCNLFGRGRHHEFASYIRHKYGEEELEKLTIASRRVTKFHSYDLEAMIAYYERELKSL